MLFQALKALCVVFYLAAVASLFGVFAAPAAFMLQVMSLLLVAVHALELLFVMPLVRRWPGPLGLSVLLALLFGVLHWKPLAKAG